jgi:hypothetical protein
MFTKGANVEDYLERLYRALSEESSEGAKDFHDFKRSLPFIDANDYSTFATAVGSIDSTEATLVISKPMSIADNLTIPTNVQLMFMRSGNISVPTTKTLTINGPIEAGPFDIFTLTGTGKVVFGNGYNPVVYPQWFGAKADGATDDSTALTNAIKSACGRQLVIPSGTYAIDSAVYVNSLTADSHWVADGPVIISKIGTTAIYQNFYVVTGGYDLTIDGPILLDGNDKSWSGLIVYNDCATMAGASRVIMRDVMAQDVYSDDVPAHGAYGIRVSGGYTLVKMDSCGAIGVGREAGDSAGKIACIGISVGWIDVNAYPKYVVINDPYISDIDCDETDDSAIYYDMDGISIIGPGAGSSTPAGTKFDTFAVIRGGSIINAHGRAIKSQFENIIVDGVKIISDSANTKRLMKQHVAVDFQMGTGTLRDSVFQYDTLASGATPFWNYGTGTQSLVNASYRGVAANEGSLTVTGNRIYNNVASATGKLGLFVCTSKVAPGDNFDSIWIEDNQFLGVGVIEYALKGSLEHVQTINFNGNHFNTLSGGIYANLAGDSSGCTVLATGNENIGSTVDLVSGNGTGATVGLFVGNIGFNAPTGAAAGLFVDGDAFIGDGTNNTEIESDGTLVFNGTATVWNDVNIGSASMGAGATAPDLVAINGTTVYARGFDGNATTEQLFAELEIPHSAKNASEATFHVHWMPTTATAGNVKWQMDYHLLDASGTAGAVTTLTATTASPAVAWKEVRSDLSPTITVSMGQQLVFRLYRNPSDAADTYPDDAVLLTAGLHYESDTVGSRAITTK